MNKIVTYLESKEVVFHGALLLILLYVPHAGHLFKQLEHLDMSFLGLRSFLNWVYGIALASVIEFIISDLYSQWLSNNRKILCTLSAFLLMLCTMTIGLLRTE
jgi:uncharacterized PurR-regulated membrane protein YhhQ (DUF165 family)